jgi:hypothetical protein
MEHALDVAPKYPTKPGYMERAKRSVSGSTVCLYNCSRILAASVLHHGVIFCSLCGGGVLRYPVLKWLLFRN